MFYFINIEHQNYMIFLRLHEHQQYSQWDWVVGYHHPNLPARNWSAEQCRDSTTKIDVL